MYLLGPGKAAFVFFTDRLAPEVRIKQKNKYIGMYLQIFIN